MTNDRRRTDFKEIIHQTRDRLSQGFCHVTLADIMKISLSPYDTLPSALLRFVLELAALFTIGQAFGIGNFLISAVALAVFNAKGDKRFQGILVSGPIRLMIEVVIALIGIYATLLVYGEIWAAGFAVLWVSNLFLGRERLLWLARGAK